MPTFGILVGGGPAPGINGVIGAATVAARRRGVRVVGIEDGFQWLMRGETSHVRDLQIEDVSRIHLLGGSVLRTSRANPTRRPEDLARVVDTLRAIGIDSLITIGGDDTCFSAREIARAAGGDIQVAHVPKTIDNDLPLPRGVPTFGFESARSAAALTLTHLMEDARTTGRWYVAVLMGRSAGHLAFGAACSAGVTLSLVAEEFDAGPISLGRIAAIVEGAVVKRLAAGRNHGVVVLAEGLGERLDPASVSDLPDLPLDEHGHPRLAELPLGNIVTREVRTRLAEIGHSTTMIAKDIGYELRSAPPNAFDIAYARELGAGATLSLLDGASEVMITMQDEAVVAVPFGEILDPETGRTRVRMLDLESPAVRIARTLQIRMQPEDLEPGQLRERLEQVTGLDADALRQRYFA